MADLYANVTEFTGAITLTAGVDANVQSFSFSGTIPAGLRGGTSRWRIDNEIVIATINAGGTSPMTVVREAEGSTPASHSSGAVLRHYLTAGTIEAIQIQLDSAGSGHVIEDEGTPLTARANLNFTGAGVDVADSGGKTVVTVSGGGGGASPPFAIADTTGLQTALDGKQPLDSDLTVIAGLSPSNDDIAQRKAGAWTNRTPAQVKTDLVLVKGDVGLGSVDNTADTAKPVSSATQTALNAKQDAATAATQAELDAEAATREAADADLQTQLNAVGGSGVFIQASSPTEGALPWLWLPVVGSAWDETFHVYVPSAPGGQLLLETGDTLTTEAGDLLVMEA